MVAFRYDRVAMLNQLRQKVETAVDRASIDLQNEIKQVLTTGGASNIGSGGRASKPGGPPAVDTGSLRRSIQVDRSKLSEDLRNRVGTNLKYGRIQEFGGVVRAKSVKALPVPLTPEAKVLLRRTSGSIRSLNLTPIKTKKGDLLLVRMKPGRKIAQKHGGGTREAWEPLFILKKSVRLPARPYLRPALAAALPRMRQRFTEQGFKLKGVA